MTQEITCFKAYDVRGRIPDQLNEDVAYRIGQAFAEVIEPGKVVVGHDIRLTSEAIKAALRLYCTTSASPQTVICDWNRRRGSGIRCRRSASAMWTKKKIKSA